MLFGVSRVTTLLLAYACLATAVTTFTVPHVAGQDDTPALLEAMKDLSSDSTILFESGITYNIFTPIQFPKLTNVEIRIEGNLTYPTDIPTIQKIVAAADFPGSWITFTGGTNVTLRGSLDPHCGWIDGHGQAWWDAQNQINRPHGIAFSHINNGVIRDMKIWKPIAWNFATSGSSNIHAFNNKIMAVSSTQSFPFNTDGFSAGGSNMIFEDNLIQNGDDCLTVGSGASNITFRDSYCEGGHGLSIGSLGNAGQVANVQNVLIENIQMKNSLYGARFKSWAGGNGLARNITWRNIAFVDVPFPIYVTQNYWDQGAGPKPNSTSSNNTHIQDFIFENFTGIIKDKPYVEGSCITNPCWYAVPGATGKEVIIYDLAPNTSSNIVAKNIVATTQTHAPVAVMCDPKAITYNTGFKCWNGLYLPTSK